MNLLKCLSHGKGAKSLKVQLHSKFDMEQQPETRSIAEVIMQGDGRYSTLFRVDKLGDGTYLVYEKEKLFGLWEGFARVHRLEPTREDYLQGAVTSYQSGESEKRIARRLTDMIFKSE